MFSKIKVNGPEACDLYKYLTDKDASNFGGKIKWNFTKFLISPEGQIVNRYASKSTPEEIEKDLLERF